MNQDRGWDADDEDEDEKMSAADREMTRPCLLETSPRPPYVLFHERLNWRWYYAQFYNRFRSSYRRIQKPKKIRKAFFWGPQLFGAPRMPLVLLP